MPIVSVIIPIYNVEKYLSRCLNSVCNNELSNIEIICVDDGSQDNCGKICDEYAEKDRRIKVIHKNNGGLSSARNAGMGIAKGKFIYFIDPDDDFDPSMLVKLVAIAEQQHCEVVICGYKTMPDEKVIIPLFELNKVLNPRKMIMNNNRIHSHNDLCFTWRFLFEKNTIKENDIRFNENILFAEDSVFNLEVLLKAKNVYVLDEPLYYYTVNNKFSIMRKNYKEHLESSLILQYDIKKKLYIEYELIKSKNYIDDMANYYINNIMPMMIKNIYNGSEENKKTAIKRILNYEMYRDSCKQIGFLYKFNNFKEYIVYLAIKYKIYYILYYVWNKKYNHMFQFL